MSVTEDLNKAKPAVGGIVDNRLPQKEPALVQPTVEINFSDRKKIATANWDDLREMVSHCKACKILCESRLSTVFGIAEHYFFGDHSGACRADGFGGASAGGAGGQAGAFQRRGARVRHRQDAPSRCVPQELFLYEGTFRAALFHVSRDLSSDFVHERALCRLHIRGGASDHRSHVVSDDDLYSVCKLLHLRETQIFPWQG